MLYVPFSEEYVGAEEQAAIGRAVVEHHLVGNGPIAKQAEQTISELFGVKHVMLTTSCTHALEMAMIALDIRPGDEVIMPSFTFVSTANCVVLRGATPVFADIQPDTLNLDAQDVRRRITPRTRAIVPVHYAGVSCDMDALRTLATEHQLMLVEDAAQGVDAYYKGQALGSIGDFGCYSFHATKNIVCGEGGALLTNNDQLAARARIIHEKGTNRAAFLQGLVDKYSWVGAGSSYVLSDMLAAMLQVQLAKRQDIRERRAAIWHTYAKAFAPLASQGVVSMQHIPDECEANYHIFFLRVSSPEIRAQLLHDLRVAGIQAAFHYVPLHTSPFGKQQGWNKAQLPVTDWCSSTLIRLPLFPAMTRQQQEYVIEQTTALLLSYSQNNAEQCGETLQMAAI